MNAAIVLAAGEGLRFGRQGEKQFIDLLGKPLLAYAVAALQKAKSVDRIVIVTRAEQIDLCREKVVKLFADNVVDIVPGGRCRQDSVYQGLRSLPSTTKKVIIHDGVRPLITPEKIDEVTLACSPAAGAILAIPVTDTIKRVDDTIIRETVDRRRLWLAQTPQVFDYKVILKAHQTSKETGFYGTDDAVLVERINHPVKIIMGEYDNIKVTIPVDLTIAEALFRKRTGF